MQFLEKSSSAPWGLKWRSSVWFATIVVGFGITVDLLVYSIIIPVIPFQLQKLGYQDVSALVGWLLFAYSGGLVVSTPPIAWLSERYQLRRSPLLIGLFCLIGSSVMFMLAPTYWVMIIARILQGISSSIVWVVGLALLCDITPEERVGQQLGLAMMGMTIGLVIAPPIGGALYGHYGFHAPFIFGIIASAIDAIGRLLLIEKNDALSYGYDPTSTTKETPTLTTLEQCDPSGPSSPDTPDSRTVTDPNSPAHVPQLLAAQSPSSSGHRSLTPLGVLLTLSKSARAIATILVILIYGIVATYIEPTVPLRLQAIWNLDSSQVGIVFVAIAVPSVFSAPLTGWASDHYGTRWVSVLCPLLSMPWWIVLFVRWHLALFIASLALAVFFMSGIIAPVTAELAAVSRGIPGIGYAHVYGAFNLAYGVGSAIGPLVAGQIYDHAPQGWLVICFLAAGLSLLASIISGVYIGERSRTSTIVL